jgi:hypothetical protein
MRWGDTPPRLVVLTRNIDDFLERFVFCPSKLRHAIRNILYLSWAMYDILSCGRYANGKELPNTWYLCKSCRSWCQRSLRYRSSCWYLVIICYLCDLLVYWYWYQRLICPCHISKVSDYHSPQTGEFQRTTYWEFRLMISEISPEMVWKKMWFMTKSTLNYDYRILLLNVFSSREPRC